jgi:O-antigen/teichoic acid export membrane protein
MGENEYGAYAYAFAWAYLLAALSGLGLTTGVLKFIPRFLVEKDWARLKGIICRSRQLTLVAGILLATMGTVTVLGLQPPKINPHTLLVGMWLVPLLAALNLQAEIIRGAKRVALAYFPPLILLPILSLGFAGFMMLTGGTLTSRLTMSAVLLALMVSLAAQAWSIGSILPEHIKQTPAIYETVEWLRISLPLMLMTGFQFVFSKTDLLMVGMLIGPKQAGIYNVTSKTASLVMIVLTAVNAISAPMIASCYARGDMVSLQRLVHGAMKWTAGFSLIIALGIIIMGTPILELFGAAFVEGYWALAILVGGQLINACAGPVGYLLILTEYQALTAYVLGWSAAANIVLNALLIPRWGIVGAAVASMTSMAIWNIWLWKLARKHLGIRAFRFRKSKIPARPSRK